MKEIEIICWILLGAGLGFLFGCYGIHLGLKYKSKKLGLLKEYLKISGIKK